MPLDGRQFSHYRMLRLIGRGGMGEVYLAEDIQIGRQVAVKVVTIEAIQPDDEAIATALRLFLREATTIARLDHPHILPLYDYGEIHLDGSHVAYLIIPYRPEGSLITWLRKRAQEQHTQQLTLKQVAHVIQQAGQALQYAHDHQVLHLDVKPANFLIRSTSATNAYPDLLLSDFGIARLASATSSASQQVRGTPAYMAPEQWAGQPVFASDQYALAIMAYELLTGSPPFQGQPLKVMYSHLHEPPKPTRDSNPLLPPAVDLVLWRALAKQPQERFPSVAAFAQAFQDAFQGMDEATTLRMLHLAPATPPLPQTPPPSFTGDIHTTLVLSAQEARSGVARTLILASGRAVSVHIPPGAQFGQVLVLSGQGEVPGPNTPAGNLYITLTDHVVLCRSCQAMIPSEMASCPRCGLPVAQPPPVIPFQQPAVAPPPPAGSPVHLPPAPASVVQPRRRWKSGCGTAAIVLLIVLLGGGALYGGLYYYGHVGIYQQIYSQATSGQPTYTFSLASQQSPWPVARTADGTCSYGSDGYQIAVNPNALNDAFACLDTQHHYSSGTLTFQVQMRMHTGGGMGGITLVDCDSTIRNTDDGVYAIDPVSDYKFGDLLEQAAFASSNGPQAASFNEFKLYLHDNGDSTSSAVHMGQNQLNQLTAVMQGGVLYMYINQQYAWQTGISPATTCTLGLVAIDQASSVSFTNVQIWSK